MDLCSAVPWFSMKGSIRDLMWDDGLHLTRDGYEMMGDAIAAKLVELLHKVKEPPNIRLSEK